MPTGPAPINFDRLVHAAQAGFTAGLSPTSTALAVLDWAVHLGGSRASSKNWRARRFANSSASR